MISRQLTRITSWMVVLLAEIVSAKQRMGLERRPCGSTFLMDWDWKGWEPSRTHIKRSVRRANMRLRKEGWMAYHLGCQFNARSQHNTVENTILSGSGQRMELRQTHCESSRWTKRLQKKMSNWRDDMRKSRNGAGEGKWNMIPWGQRHLHWQILIEVLFFLAWRKQK